MPTIHAEQRLREGRTLQTRHQRWGAMDLWFFPGDKSESEPAEFVAQRWRDGKVTMFPTFKGLFDRLAHCTEAEWSEQQEGQ